MGGLGGGFGSAEGGVQGGTEGGAEGGAGKGDGRRAQGCAAATLVSLAHASRITLCHLIDIRWCGDFRIG